MLGKDQPQIIKILMRIKARPPLLDPLVIAIKANSAYLITLSSAQVQIHRTIAINKRVIRWGELEYQTRLFCLGGQTTEHAPSIGLCY